MEYGPAPESSSTAMNWIKDHEGKFQLFINGKWQEPTLKKYFDTVNPATEDKLAKVADAESKDIDKAVAAARKALPESVKLGAHGRARYLYAIARQIQKNSRLFSVLESLDNGKTI